MFSYHFIVLFYMLVDVIILCPTMYLLYSIE